MRYPVCLFLVALGAMALVLADDTRPTPRGRASADVALYDSDPKHLWNRLHASLFVRTDANGKHLGHDEVDPLIWPDSTYLLRGQRNKEAIKFLDEFLKEGIGQVRDPLRRALLQHDLWTLFDWTDHTWVRALNLESLRRPEWETSRRALRARLAEAIKRLALSKEELAGLPDNYADAVASGKFPASFDPGKPETAFLPANLLDSGGPWVCVRGTNDGPAGPVHVRFGSGRSNFLIFLTLPGGREATLAYLNKLNLFPRPWVTADPPLGTRGSGDMAVTVRNHPLRLNPDLPELPPGTQVALVRQMMLPDAAGRPLPTRITQSVQFRVFSRAGKEGAPGEQHFFEFQTRRGLLLSGKDGGMHVVDREEIAWLTLNFLTGTEPFEPDVDLPRHSHRMSVMKTCQSCHPNSRSGIRNVQTFTQDFLTAKDHNLQLRTTDVEAEQRETVQWKINQHDWGMLQGLLER